MKKKVAPVVEKKNFLLDPDVRLTSSENTSAYREYFRVNGNKAGFVEHASNLACEDYLKRYRFPEIDEQERSGNLFIDCCRTPQANSPRQTVSVGLRTVVEYSIDERYISIHPLFPVYSRFVEINCPEEAGYYYNIIREDIIAKKCPSGLHMATIETPLHFAEDGKRLKDEYYFETGNDTRFANCFNTLLYERNAESSWMTPAHSANWKWKSRGRQNFVGKWEFLKMEYVCAVYDTELNMVFPSAYNAWVAHAFNKESDREKFVNIMPDKAKILVNKMKKRMRKDWKEIRDDVLEHVLICKFNDELDDLKKMRTKLLMTRGENEDDGGNLIYWSLDDEYFGLVYDTVVKSTINEDGTVSRESTPNIRGKNKLGIALTRVRDMLAVDYKDCYFDDAWHDEPEDIIGCMVYNRTYVTPDSADDFVDSDSFFSFFSSSAEEAAFIELDDEFDDEIDDEIDDELADEASESDC